MPAEFIESKIYLICGKKIMLDSDLAELYAVSTKRFNEQVRRNIERFPSDFMFQLTKEEYDSLRSQIATLKQERGQHRKYLPYAFTEHGAIMAATILNSPKAIEMSVFVVRAFVKLREILSTNKELIHKLNELDKKYEKHDKDIKIIIETIRQLMSPPEKPERKIGFKTGK
ncbi:MAG: ORF6N domain-containing protein [Deltaproteobacteria bacterium]|nr:ORF6N domain-containing protein [Deltaproteobacteria bacterium]